MQYDDSTYVLDFSIERSSLIERVEYCENQKYLVVWVRYLKQPVLYEGVEYSFFEEFTKTESVGKYYLHFIKPNFKQVKRNFMPENDEKKQLPTKNMASNQTRRIDFDIDVTKIIKEWIYAGKKGNWLKCQLVMKPDGEMDKYGGLGFITQPVPYELYKAAEAKQKGSGKLIENPILGNAREIDWDAFKGNSADDVANAELGGVPDEELPF